MKKKEKIIILKKIKNKIKKYRYLYFIDISRFTSTILYSFKKECYNNNIFLKNIKNNLLKKIFQKKIHIFFNGPTFIMFSKDISLPAKIIKNNQFFINNIIYPIFKGAIIDSIEYYGNKNNIEELINIFPKEYTIIKIIFFLKKIINFNLIKYNLYINFKFLNIIKKLNNNK